MTSASPFPACSPQAVEVAWKYRWRGYDSEEAAIRALRRRCRGLAPSDAASVLHAGLQLIERAIRVLKPHMESLAGIYRSRGEIAPSDIEPFAPELAQHFPDCPLDAVRSALWSATVYHMR